MENRRARMELKIEPLYGWRGPEVGRGEVIVEILFDRMDYKVGHVPGGFVLDQNRHGRYIFDVARNPDLVDLSLGRIYDAIAGAGLRINLKEEFIREMKLAVIALPPTEGVGILPEILATMCIKTHPVVSTVTRSEQAHASALARRVNVPETRRVRRRLNDNEGTTILERIRWSDIFKQGEEWCCLICLDTCTSDDEKMTRLPCKHVFHEDCINEWLKRSRSCPTCRHFLVARPLIND